jgi:hypothetical protein
MDPLCLFFVRVTHGLPLVVLSSFSQEPCGQSSLGLFLTKTPRPQPLRLAVNPLAPDITPDQTPRQ